MEVFVCFHHIYKLITISNLPCSKLLPQPFGFSFYEVCSALSPPISRYFPPILWPFKLLVYPFADVTDSLFHGALLQFFLSLSHSLSAVSYILANHVYCIVYLNYLCLCSQSILISINYRKK